MREFLKNPAIDLSVDVLCQIMKDRNAAYDRLNTHDLLSADEVVAILPSLGIEMCGESFARPTNDALKHGRSDVFN